MNGLDNRWDGVQKKETVKVNTKEIEELLCQKKNIKEEKL